MQSLLGLVAALHLATQPQASRLPQADHRQLLQLAERMDRAWTAGNPAANAQLFALDATARFGDEPLGAGRAQIRSQFEGFFKDRPPGLRHVTSIERIERLATDLAMWDAEVRVERQQADGQWAALTRIRNMTVAVRQPDGWRVKAVRAFPLN